MIETRLEGQPLILLTAAVSPNVRGKIAVADPAIRLLQYQRALAEWSSCAARLGFRLAVVETTGARAEDLLREVGEEEAERIPVVSFVPSPGETERGKGAVELAAIRKAVEDDEVATPGDTLYKCTGRLMLTNASRVLTSVGAGTVRVRMTADRSWVDSRLLGAKAETWAEHLFPAMDTLDDASGRYLERVLAARLAAANALGDVKIERFPARPLLSGVSGSTGKSYRTRTGWLKDRALRPFETLLSELSSRKQV